MTARAAREAIDARRQSSVAAALQVLHQPGVAGVSQLDVASIPSAWLYARNYEQRLTAHLDAVTLETGHLGGSFNRTASLGTVQAAGPNAPLRFSNDRQAGLATLPRATRPIPSTRISAARRLALYCQMSSVESSGTDVHSPT